MMKELMPTEVYYEDGAAHPAAQQPERKVLKKQLNQERRSAGRALRRDAEFLSAVKAREARSAQAAQARAEFRTNEYFEEQAQKRSIMFDEI